MALDETLDDLRARLDRVRAVAGTEPGAVAEAASGPLPEPVPGAPEAAVAVYGVVGRLQGDYFRFTRPPELASPRAWAEREVDPDDPMGGPLIIGYEIASVPAVAAADIPGGDPIYLDADDGGVYYLEPDDYAFLHENPGEDVDIEDFAPDLASFMTAHVLGERYPELVAAVLGFRVDVEKDAWWRLLRAAGLAG